MLLFCHYLKKKKKNQNHFIYIIMKYSHLRIGTRLVAHCKTEPIISDITINIPVSRHIATYIFGDCQSFLLLYFHLHSVS